MNKRGKIIRTIAAVRPKMKIRTRSQRGRIPLGDSVAAKKRSSAKSRDSLHFGVLFFNGPACLKESRQESFLIAGRWAIRP